MKHWTLNDIHWNLFDPSKLNPDLVKVVKAAALVEYNAADYDRYLSAIFAKDPTFQEASHTWAQEEIQHGEALARWAKLADSSFDFEGALAIFRAGFQVQQDIDVSIRGSLAGELIARCIVEIGTSSFYSAIKDATDEPVLKEICTHIAADEFRHYKLFYDHLHRFLEHTPLTVKERLRIALGRMAEADDDELSMAYYAANLTERSKPYLRKENAQAYLGRAYALYKKEHVRRGVNMILKAVGLSPQGILARLSFVVFWGALQLKRKSL